jgi:hypothetical protein
LANALLANLLSSQKILADLQMKINNEEEKGKRFLYEFVKGKT